MKNTRSAGGVVLNKKGRVLVVSQRGNSWSLPKGHLDKGESPLEAARREVLEESGVGRLELVKKLGAYTRYRIGKDGGEDRAERKHMTFYLFTTAQMRLKPRDVNHPEARWVKPADVAGMLTHPSDARFFSRVIKDVRRCSKSLS